MGEELAAGATEKLATVFNVRGNHWVLVVLDFISGESHYGNSMDGHPPDSELMAMLDWWTDLHTKQHMALQILQSAHQTDDFSCGPFAVNALTHHLIPHQHDLFTVNDSLTSRYHYLQEIILVHEENVHK